MTRILRAPLAAIAAAAVMTAASAAHPAKTDSRPPAPAHTVAAPVVLASASEVRTPSAADAQRPADPAKRRIARVTTCRCGDSQPDEAQPDQ
jgi:hypothetical protein